MVSPPKRGSAPFCGHDLGPIGLNSRAEHGTEDSGELRSHLGSHVAKLQLPQPGCRLASIAALLAKAVSHACVC